MPTLFISYKRGTSAVAPLMARLRDAHYRLWFDRDEIHLGDTDWQARIDQGIQRCDGLILNLTPAACASEPVQYEVKKAQELGKPIFPIVLEKIADWGTALIQVGLTPSHHTEDFTDAEKWDEQVQRLLRDLKKQGLTVTRHDRRAERDRNNPSYILHQTYLKKLAERVGTLNLARIQEGKAQGVALERVYVDSPTGYNISVEVQDWQIMDWWINAARRFGKAEDEYAKVRYKPEDLNFERVPFETLIGNIDAQIQQYRKDNPDAKPDEEYSFHNPWNNGEKKNSLDIHLNHLAAARDRLVILGDPGSGKSTFVKYLALCLAGAGIDGWPRSADIASLDNWPHGVLTPVYVELRRFVTSEHFPHDAESPATADHLWNYIQHEWLGDDLQAYADDLRYDLEHGHAVLILDGLDEVPYPEGRLGDRQQQLIGLAQSLNTRYANSRIIVASRPYAYEGWTLPGFEAVTITAFKDAHRTELAQRLYQASGLAEDTAKEKAKALNNQLRQIDPELKDRPLFVTLMATIYLKGESEGLPTRRGALYRESILLLLDRWTQSKREMPSLVELLGDKHVDDLYNRLAALAYDIHNTYGDQPGTPEIDESLLYKHLKPLGRTTAAELIPYLSENAGVLVSPGQDDERDVFHFAHRTFQEYLAAAHLTTTCLDNDSFRQIAQHITGKPQIWRVPGTLMGDVLADTDRRGDLWELLEDLLDDDSLDEMSSDDPGWWRVWLAAVITAEQKLHEQPQLRRSERTVRDLLVERIVKLIEMPQALEPVERATCSRILGLLGDPRPGVGVRDDGLPDIAWSAIIPPGTYPIGGDDEARGSLPAADYKLTYSYQVSKYPVTYAQFEAFLTAPDGYASEDHNWFEGLAADESDRRMNEQAFKYANHPRETVNWYQALAFCRWLSWKETGRFYALEEIAEWPVRLPTEQEWEIAARGEAGLYYPYGNDFDPAKGNVDDTGIGQTSAVGIFSEGVSWCGTLDMSGNVWEWCLNPFDSPEAVLVTNNLIYNTRRVLRGGSWFIDRSLARAASRSGSYPDSRFNRGGFRLCCVRAPSL